MCFSTPTSARFAELILIYSTSYDSNNKFYINNLLFQAFTGIFYRLQVSQTNIEFVNHFVATLNTFIQQPNNKML